MNAVMPVIMILKVLVLHWAFASMIQRMNGELLAESKSGIGTTFYYSLPLAECGGINWLASK